VATIGVGLLPSALIHSAVASRPGLLRRGRLAILLGYIPTIGVLPAAYYSFALPREEFLNALRDIPGLMGLLGAWFVASLALAGRVMSAAAGADGVEGAGQAPGGQAGGPSDRRARARYARTFGLGLVGIAGSVAVLLAVELAAGGRSEVVDATMQTFVMALSLMPGGLLVYYIYRYRYMDLTLRRSLSFAALVVAVVLAHGLLIRRFTAYLKDIYDVDSALLEGALVVGVVLLFEPVRRRLQAAIDAAIAPGHVRRRERLAALQGEVASFPPGDLRPVVARTREGLSEVYGSPAVVCIRLPSSGPADDEADLDSAGSPEIVCSPPGAARDTAPLCDWAIAAIEGPLACGELPAGAASAAARLALANVFPIRGQAPDRAPRGGDPGGVTELDPAVGFMGLGAGTEPLGQEDAAAMTGLARTLTAAARDALAVRRLVALEHKLAEAERLSSLGRLSATIAHEVKNPLSSIKTIVGVLRESAGADTAAARDLGVVASEVERLTAVVGNLLDVARPRRKPGEGTALVPPPEGFDAREMIEGLLVVLGPDARRRGVGLETRFEPGAPRIYARESAMRQAAFQVLLNAIEITPPGGTVTLSTGPAGREEGDPSRREVEIVVEDTGPGLPSERPERIFEPFFSLKPHGTGLGLGMAKEEVAHAGGRIEAGPRADGRRGARFRIVLPAAARMAPT